MKKQLPGLQVLRGIAACAVVIHHAQSWIPMQDAATRYLRTLDLGSRGVELFFVLSGFIIYYVHKGDSGGTRAFAGYWRKRVVRIFPISFIVASLYFAQINAGDILHLAMGELNWGSWASSALILPALERPLPVVIWTLRHELFFYLVFSLIFFSSRLFWIGIALWTLVCVLLASPEETTYAGTGVYLYVLGGSINMLFLVGLVVAFLFERVRLPASGAGLHVPLAGTLLLAGVIFLPLASGLDPRLVLLLFGFVSGYAIYAFCLIGSAVPLLNSLGDASFSIYLTHLPLFSFAKYAAYPLVAVQPLLGMLVLSGLAITGGVVVYKVLEKPLLRRLNRRNRQLPPPALA